MLTHLQCIEMKLFYADDTFLQLTLNNQERKSMLVTAVRGSKTCGARRGLAGRRKHRASRLSYRPPRMCIAMLKERDQGSLFGKRTNDIVYDTKELHLAYTRKL